MNPQIERVVSQDLIRKYAGRGYKVVDDPRVAPLPPEAGSYVPDLVLERDGRYLAIEIKGRRVPALVRALDGIKDRIERDERWSFEVVFLDELETQPHLPIESQAAIDATLGETRALAEDNRYRPAFLLLWPALEAVARTVESQSLALPQSPVRIITVLAEQGHIDPDEASTLRRLAMKRNALVHGDLSVDITLADFEAALRVIEKILYHTPNAPKLSAAS